MSTSEIIKARREALGLTEEGLAELCGVSRGAVQHWERPNGTAPRRKIQAKVAEVLGITVAELMHGQSNVEEGPPVRGAVPLINSVQAGNYVCFVDNHHPGDGGMEMVTTSAPVGKHTYALKVSGDSMEPEFMDGQILIVEPELEPMPGDFVIARLVDGEETTFKQLVKDGPEWFLKPLNERYPIRPLGDATIVGVLRAVEKRYR